MEVGTMRKPATNRTKGQKKRPKTKLAIPDLEHSKLAVLRSLGSPDSRRGYQHAIDEFVAWYCSEPQLAFNKTVVLRYRFYLEERGLAPATINVRLAAMRRLAYEAANAGLLSPELAAGIHRGRPTAELLLETGIEQSWPSCSVADYGAANLRNLPWKACSVARSAGPSWTWSAKEGTYGLSLYRNG
jgi:hypothetical protein